MITEEMPEKFRNAKAKHIFLKETIAGGCVAAVMVSHQENGPPCPNCSGVNLCFLTADEQLYQFNLTLGEAARLLFMLHKAFEGFKESVGFDLLKKDSSECEE